MTGVLLFKFLIFTAIAAVSPQILPGVKVKGIGAAASVALIFGLLNLLFGWILGLAVKLVTLPLACLTFGIFWVLIPMLVNAVLLKVTDAFLDPFELDGWWPALGMGLLFGLASLVANIFA